jgi:hypothetical protein
MQRRLVYRVLSVLLFAMLGGAIANGQKAALPLDQSNRSWEIAQARSSSTHRLFVVTFDQPYRRQACHVQSFTPEKLVCSRAMGGPRTYLREQVVALILPGDGHLKMWVMLGLNGSMGAAIWGSIVLAAACPACAAATAFAALYFFSGAVATLASDDAPNRLLYLAPGRELSRKLGYVKR